jgi:hypothetical protein
MALNWPACHADEPAIAFVRSDRAVSGGRSAPMSPMRSSGFGVLVGKSDRRPNVRGPPSQTAIYAVASRRWPDAIEPVSGRALRRYLSGCVMSGSDPRPERSPLVEITWTEALLWLNDRCGSIVSVTVGVADDAPTGAVLLIGDSELHHWSEGETPEYVAGQMDELRPGSYRLGRRTLINLEQPADKSCRCRANRAHLVIDLDTHVSLRITGRKPES